jgi:monoamine oxidase
MSEVGGRMDRRTFLRLLAIAGGAAALAPVLSQPGRKVVVLGAGLAGLAAAWNLMNAGYEVVVLEAQDMPGGRVKTIREPFRNGGYTEAGAVRIFKDHRWTMKYIRLMGLESKLAPLDDEGAHLWYLQGKRFVTRQGVWPTVGLTSREEANPAKMLDTYWGPGFQAVGDPTRSDFPTASALTLDRYRFHEFLKQNGASDAWIRALLATEGDISRMNALAVTALFGAPNDGAPTQPFGMIGGNDQLPQAIAAALGTRVRYNSPVLRLAHDEKGVVVTVCDPTGQHEARADHCVCALPFPLLRRVVIAPSFSHLKMQAIEQYQLIAIARVCFQTRTRFWHHDPLGRLGGLNMVGTDTPAERIWNVSRLQPDPTMGMLQSYVVDQNALAFARIPPGDRVKEWLRIIARFMPQLPQEVEATWSKAWQEDPWQRGGFAFAQPNQFAWLWPAARRPEGRVHFAGEHTSLWIGYQNGALESAERCVEEIRRAARA